MVSFFFSLSLCFCSPDSGAEAAQLFPIEPFFNLARPFSFDLNISGRIVYDYINNLVCKPCKNEIHPLSTAAPSAWWVELLDGIYIPDIDLHYDIRVPLFVKLDKMLDL